MDIHPAIVFHGEIDPWPLGVLTRAAQPNGGGDGHRRRPREAVVVMMSPDLDLVRTRGAGKASTPRRLRARCESRWTRCRYR
jgi:hypothetical protein